MNSVISVNPALIRVNLTDEASTNVRFEITNTSNLTLPIGLKVFDVGGASHTSVPWAYGAILSPQYGLQRWMTVDAPTVVLHPGETAPVTATIRPNSTMPAGGHYGSIVAALDSSESPVAARVGIQGRLSVLVFATKAGGHEALTLSNPKIDRHLWSWPDTVSLAFTNTGTVDVTPHGRVTMTGPKESTSSVVFNTESQPVFPENSHIYTVRIPTSHYLPGRYHMTVSYQAGQTITDTRELSLLIIPPWLLLAGTIFLLLIVWTFIHKQRRR